jgi:hypothetical protein
MFKQYVLSSVVIAFCLIVTNWNTNYLNPDEVVGGQFVYCDVQYFQTEYCDGSCSTIGGINWYPAVFASEDHLKYPNGACSDYTDSTGAPCAGPSFSGATSAENSGCIVNW